MDKIIIRNLRIEGILGVNPEERVKPQEVLINATIFFDISNAAKTEDLAATVNYYEVAQKIAKHVEAAEDLLIEKLIIDVATVIVKEFAVEKVKLKIEKPEAVNICESVGIEIERTKEQLLG